MKEKIENLSDIVQVVQDNYVINHPDEFTQFGEDGLLFYNFEEKDEKEEKNS